MGEMEEILQFVIPKVYQIAALNGCHREARHPGQQKIQFLFEDLFLLPGMGNQMQIMLKNCKRCIQLEGTQSNVALHPSIVTAQLELLDVHYTSIEMTLELNKPTKVVDTLVFQDHFMKHVMG